MPLTISGNDIGVDEIRDLLESDKRIIFVCECGADINVYIYRNGVGDLIVEPDRCELCERAAFNEGYTCGKSAANEEVFNKGYKKGKEDGLVGARRKSRDEITRQLLDEYKRRKLELEDG